MAVLQGSQVWCLGSKQSEGCSLSPGAEVTPLLPGLGSSWGSQQRCRTRYCSELQVSCTQLCLGG